MYIVGPQRWKANLDLGVLKDITTEKYNLNVSSSIKWELQCHLLNRFYKVITTSELTFNVYKSALKTAKHYANVTCYFDYSFLMFSVFFLGWISTWY